MKYQDVLLSLSLCSALLIQSCGPKIIKMEPIVELKGGSPLNGIAPLKFIIRNFKNEAGEIVGFGIKPGGVLRPAKLDQRASEIVVKAIAAELRRNGHTVLVTEDTKKADVIIEGTVTNFQVIVFESLFTAPELRCYVQTKISATSASCSDIILSKLYNGFCNIKGIRAGKWREGLNEALRNMVEDFTKDQDFLNALKKIINLNPAVKFPKKCHFLNNYN